jgi:serine/threonine-protein kinase
VIQGLSGRYEIVSELGRGGMATVYLAEDLKLRRRVALKLLRPELAATLGTQRFLREIEIAARLSHPNILQLHDSGEINGQPFYAMPYVEGESLRQRLSREPQLPLKEVVALVQGIAAALDHAHQAGVIHRDIKPENVLLAQSPGSSGCHPLVADFGIARALDLAGGERLTETGLALGTPAYMSPEQAGGSGPLDRRSDVYALGCVIYEMLAGAPPFTGPTAQSVLARHALDPVPPLHTVRPELPRSVERIIERALAKVPADRFSTAGQFATSLTAAGQAGSSSPSTWRTPLAITTGIGALFLVSQLLVPRILPGRLAGKNVAASTKPRSGTRAARPTLAVLPFRSTGADARDAYFAPGMHQEMISQLGMISGLTVISRPSVMRYQDSGLSLTQIAKDLGADFLMRALVQKDSSGVGLSAELIDARAGREIWKDTYHRGVTGAGLSAIRGEVVRGVAAALHVKISSVERARISGRGTENAAAYNRFLRAIQLQYGSDPAAAVAAVELLKQAIALDSGFAPAVAELANVYSFRSYSLGESRTWADSAIVLARRALQLDSTLPESYRILGLGFVDKGRLREAADAYRDNVRLNPNDGHALEVLGRIEILRGRLAEAVPLLLDAKAVSPMDKYVYLDLHVLAKVFGNQKWAAELREAARALSPKQVPEIDLLLDEGRPREAAEEAERQVASHPSSFSALASAAKAAVATRNYRRAKEHFDAMYRLAPDDWDSWGLTYRTNYADALLKLGERKKAMELLDRTLQDAKRLVDGGDQRPGVQREIASIYGAKGDLDQAYAWLTRAVDEGWRLERYLPSQLFDFLRGTPRFHAQIARIEADVQEAEQQVARAVLTIQ